MKIASIVVASMAAFCVSAQPEEVLSMSLSLPAVEQDFSMSVPLFAAEISMPIMSMPEGPDGAAKARKLRNNFGRRMQKKGGAKAPKVTPDAESKSMSMSMMSVPLAESSMSMMSVPLAESSMSMMSVSLAESSMSMISVPMSLSVPLFEADIGISLPLSDLPGLPEEPIGAKARKLRNNLGRRDMQEVILSMSAPLVEQDFSMSVPLFEAEISIPIIPSTPEGPVDAAKARKLHTIFGRRTLEEKKGKASKGKASKKSKKGPDFSMSARLFEADISLSLLLDEDLSMSSAPIFEAEVSMSVPLFEAEISMPIIPSTPEGPVDAAKARKLNTIFGRRTLEEKKGKASKKSKKGGDFSMSARLFEADISLSLLLEEDLSMSSAPLFEADISLPLLEELSMSAPLFEAEISLSLP